MRPPFSTATLAGLVLALAGSTPAAAQPVRGPADTLHVKRHLRTGAHKGRVAIPPLLVSRSAEISEGTDEAAKADLLTRVISEALAEQGASIVGAGECARILKEKGVPTRDRRAVIRTLAAELGATSVLFGELRTYRARGGGRMAASAPASVAFTVDLLSAPEAKELWTARFAHTQHALNERPLEALRYPGRGTRWLTGDEMIHWGGEQAATALVDAP